MTKMPVILSLLIIGTLAAAASAATSLDVSIGWNGVYRAGHWAPFFVIASDDHPRNIVIELYVPHDQLQAMRISQMATIGPTPSTFPLYAPLGQGFSGWSVTLRDASTGKRLAGMNSDEYEQLPVTQGLAPATQLIVISGRNGANGLLESQLTIPNNVTCKWVPPSLLPTTPRGYDAMNLLVLDAPDLSRLSGEQQEAIIQWVRAGGELLCWMSEDAQPASSPILDSLPAIVGENTTLQLTDAAVQSAGLSARFRALKGRQLSPLPGSQPLPLFSTEASAWRRRLGFGGIVLLPVDSSAFVFSDPSRSHEFWKPLVQNAVEFTEPNNQNRNLNGIRITQQLRRGDASTVMDTLGDVPGAGSFGFSYVAIVMIGMMLVVGPIDWIVLKKLNRQPWTWITTTGWIVLLTLGALYIGHAFRSGDLHFRTMRLIDQADGMTLATIDAIGIYSPRTQDYVLKVAPDGWWEPLSTDIYGSRGGMMTDIGFHQDYHGTRPEPMRINVWNLRFLTAETIAPASPIIEASLRHESRNGTDYLVGQITNHGTVPLGNLVIRTKDVIWRITAPMAPGSSLALNEPKPIPATRPSPTRRGSTSPTTRPRSGAPVSNPVRANPTPISQPIVIRSFNDSAPDLEPTRSAQIEQILNQSSDMACIYADADNPAPVVQLQTSGAIEKHYQHIRALVQMQRSAP